ncbi:putative intracellular septation protein A [Sphingomonas changbaiensis NBRC 104936]|uniref:Inner membrane-spanning protein YciB n=1 Tax=Sphingomonas changbaiensis NBRC 104936 TaxID=1219043 RepID=A0A0E9MKE0_9SPHN|nr:septation protein A [Sphingomonas changbaiensis]GAO38004.1 putative intracellular septation protein A [Sphingomonas changbaiensis NBRC 104936]
MSDGNKPRELSPGLRMAIDFGPLAVFFIVNAMTGGPKLAKVIMATAAFMVATIAAMIASRVKAGRISPMLWITGALVVFFGGLTIVFRDDTFIKVKPTIVYTMFAVILGYGLATGKPLLKALLETAYPGLDDSGWRKLTINWTVFFIGMALLNEAVWRTQSWDFWVGFKLWGAVPLTLVFAIANIPMLMKHGLNTEKEAPLPPEG